MPYTFYHRGSKEKVRGMKDYGYQFASHVIDRLLWLELHRDLSLLQLGLNTPNRQWFKLEPVRFDPEDWSRYDGELL